MLSIKNIRLNFNLDLLNEKLDKRIKIFSGFL